jgi:hypothetical protein
LPSNVKGGVKVHVKVDVNGLSTRAFAAVHRHRFTLGRGAISGRSPGDLSTTFSTSGAAVWRRLAG